MRMRNNKKKILMIAITTYPNTSGVPCPHCGSTKTIENTTNFGRTVMNGLYCPNCGRVSYDGTEPIHIKKKKKR